MEFFTLICCKNYVVCFKRPKINEKEAWDGPFKEKIYSKREIDRERMRERERERKREKDFNNT